MTHTNTTDHSSTSFDVIVVGGGHAGIEAAYAAAKMGSKTLLVTLDIEKIGLMRCNPAVGGVGKGHLVYDISALGGLMPQLCTQTYLQVRMLNTRKGPAVQGLRLQIDKYAYNKLAVKKLQAQKNLTLLSAEVADVLVDETYTVRGVTMSDGTTYSCTTAVLTTGTFLNGRIHCGSSYFPAGGKPEEPAVGGITPFLKRIGLKIGRLKTGTPPRILTASIDFTQLEYQEPDKLTFLFEFYPHTTNSTRACYIAHTNERTHAVIAKNLHLSAMYNGNITGIGPRYCPSIEDKIGRFPDKKSHHVFIEPEGADADEIYPNGVSTSLPVDVQREYLQTIPGFENAVITKPGYAIEYDFVHPDQLDHTLAVKKASGLFLAGQINGTTGYEEAASQGLMAGINAHLKAHNLPPCILDRTQSYIGVMIDDLVSLGVDEPYRMFTSRAERRLLLRQDNAFLRLIPLGHQLGLIDNVLFADFMREKELIEQTVTAVTIAKTTPHLVALFENFEINKAEIVALTHPELSDRALQTVHAELRYGPYLKREEKEVERQKQHAKLLIPEAVSFTNVPGLSKEMQEKLKRYSPKTIAQAALIPGMTPAAIGVLVLTIKKHNKALR
jgi:tRNA uridine 5-carboxymethylaminomethyl modification enzyme